ncbi:MAG: type II secretion system F family protein [Beijerinckiaceae bacterium]|jgi:tight adherence protein B|nr:type II secretion system F family protein [Beijerinckiaceae bacterium]
MDTQSLLVALLTTFAIATIGIVLLEPLLTGEARAEKRQATIVGGTTRKRAIEEAGNRRRQVADALKELDDRQKANKRLTLEQKFLQAGVSWTRKTYWLISIGCGLGLGLLMLVLFKQPLLAIGGLFVGAFGIPGWLLKRWAKKRQKKFLEEFPNAIEAIVRGIKSGLPLNDCIRLIANEAKEPLKAEFRYIVEAQQMGVSIADSIMKIYERIPLSEVNFFSIVIQIQAKSGGNLGEILLNLSKVIRDRKRLRDKVDAMSQEAKSSAAIIGALPAVVAGLTWLGSPDYIQLMWTTNAGLIGLGICVSIMAFGMFIMRKMINFDI